MYHPIERHYMVYVCHASELSNSKSENQEKQVWEIDS
jgi:hypothetical protein